MKKTLLTLLALTFFLTGYSQHLSNRQYPELDRFVGTWTHEKAGNSFAIVLKKVELPDSHLENNIEGYYLVNNVIVKAEDGFQKSIYSGWFLFDDHNKPIRNKVRFLFIDLKTGRTGRGIMTLQSSDQLHWTVKGGETFTFLDEDGRVLFKDGAISVPKDLVLNRVK